MTESAQHPVPAMPCRNIPVTQTARHYPTLIVAGLGAVGQAFFIVGAAALASFDRIIALDLRPVPRYLRFAANTRFLQLDVRDRRRLAGILDRIETPALFVNLCAGIDNVALRRMLADREIAYVDSACCAPAGSDEVRFSRMMPYSLTGIASRRPQWLCWGINPGMVEIIARRLIATGGLRSCDVTVYEFDQLRAGTGEGHVAVGWCPDALVEEVMESPSYVVAEGRDLEDVTPGARPAVACWNGSRVASRVVGHEDIWNIGRLPQVRNASFIYGLQPEVMDILATTPEEARQRLRVPGPATPVHGLERVAVQVKDTENGDCLALVWQEDHRSIWQRYGVNAVQYQTARSILFAVQLLQHSRYGLLAGNYSASTLPVTEDDWQVINYYLDRLAIRWQDASGLCLSHKSDFPAGSVDAD